MNSVYDRPLFANKKQKRRDARTKLLNMGGIIASSPELMQAAQPMQTMMSPVTQQRNMNQGGYIPGYDEGGFIHNMKHRREDAGLPSIINQIQTGTIPPVDEQPSFNFLKNMFGGGSDVDVSATAGSVTLPGDEEVVTDDVVTDDVVTDEVVDPDLNSNEISTEEFTGPEFEEVEAARQAALDILTSDGDELAKANQLAAQVAGQPLSGTEEEQTAQYKDLIQQAFGKKANAKTIAGLNRQITGFTIAAGKDPRAVVNIANGLKAGAEAQKAQLEADQTRSDLIAKATLERGFQLEDAALSRTESLEDRTFKANLDRELATIAAEGKGRAEIGFFQNRNELIKTAFAQRAARFSGLANVGSPGQEGGKYKFVEKNKDGTIVDSEEGKKGAYRVPNPLWPTNDQIVDESSRLAAETDPTSRAAKEYFKRKEEEGTIETGNGSKKRPNKVQIDMLRNNPTAKSITFFEKKFGPGSSKQYLK